MPHSAQAKEEMSANAPKPSQQSNANRSNGTKARHIGFFSQHKMGREARNAALKSTDESCRSRGKNPY